MDNHTFKNYRLGDIATIELSNIDKKTKPGERKIRLCNFVDVYRNWSITLDMHDSLMEASASEAKINKMQLRHGQVAITKDSETKDDIGISTYVADSMEDVVLGYHCALITPDENILLGSYLNAFLHTHTALRQFENQASGSGQRYTLSKGSIEDIRVIVPSDTAMQKRISRVFELIDEKIRANQKTVMALESLADTIFGYWFMQYDFPDKDGKPYRQNGGTMIWNDELNSYIPYGWKVSTLDNLLIINSNRRRVNALEYIHYLDTSNITNNTIDSIQKLSEDYPSRAQRVIEENDIVYSTVRPCQMHYGIIKNPVSNMVASTGFAVLRSKENPQHNDIYYRFLAQPSVTKYLDNIANNSTSSYPSIEPADIGALKICLPERWDDFGFAIALFSTLHDAEQTLHEEIDELNSLREFVLPLMMNGQVHLMSQGE